jgi:hypothetical protein
MRGASRTRNGPTRSQSPKRKRKTLLLDPVEKPSASVSVSRSSSLILTSDLSKLPSGVDEVVVSVVAGAVVMDHLVEVVVNFEDVVTGVTVVIEEDVDAETEAVLVALQEATTMLLARPSTPMTLRPFPALDHSPSISSLHDLSCCESFATPH